jgi:hypothetical protein
LYSKAEAWGSCSPLYFDVPVVVVIGVGVDVGVSGVRDDVCVGACVGVCAGVGVGVDFRVGWHILDREGAPLGNLFCIMRWILSASAAFL